MFIVAGSVVNGLNVDWYKREMRYYVVPFYTRAYSIIQTEIINSLLKAPNTSVPKELVQTLNCGVFALKGNLSAALKRSNKIHEKVDKTIMHLVQAITEWERKIKTSEKDLSVLNAQLESVKKQVAIAEQSVKDKEAGAASANAAVKDAEGAMQKAMDCTRKRRRRKRFFLDLGVSTSIVSNS